MGISKQEDLGDTYDDLPDLYAKICRLRELTAQGKEDSEEYRSICLDQTDGKRRRKSRTK